MEYSIKIEKINQFLEHSQKELQRYNSTKKLIYLQQSAEKTYGAYTLLLEFIIKKEIYSHIEIRRISDKLSKKDKDFAKLFRNSENLHAFFYEGRVYDKIVINMIQESNKIIRKILNKNV